MIEILSAVFLLILSVGVLNKAAEFTTLGNHIWFGEFISNITDKIKGNKVRTFIANLSYSKGLVCIDCHTFWLTFITGSVFASLLTTSSFQFMLYTIFVTCPISMIGFINSLGKNVKAQK